MVQIHNWKHISSWPPWFYESPICQGQIWIKADDPLKLSQISNFLAEGCRQFINLTFAPSSSFHTCYDYQQNQALQKSKRRKAIFLAILWEGLVLNFFWTIPNWVRQLTSGHLPRNIISSIRCFIPCPNPYQPNPTYSFCATSKDWSGLFIAKNLENDPTFIVKLILQIKIIKDLPYFTEYSNWIWQLIIGKLPPQKICLCTLLIFYPLLIKVGPLVVCLETCGSSFLSLRVKQLTDTNI